MGEVYKARDTRLDRTVAIKVLPAQVSSDPELRERFDREARAISQLNHPHICALYDIGHQNNVDFLVLEYLQGETLAERIARKGALPLDQMLQIAVETDDRRPQLARPASPLAHQCSAESLLLLIKGDAVELAFRRHSAAEMD